MPAEKLYTYMVVLEVWLNCGVTFFSICIVWDFYIVLGFLASPYTTSTPNINSVRNADSRGSLISTDSGNSLPERHSDKSNSLDKVKKTNQNKKPKVYSQNFILILIEVDFSNLHWEWAF